MREREPDHRKLYTKLKTKSNKAHRDKRRKYKKKNYTPNAAMAEAFRKANEDFED